MDFVINGRFLTQRLTGVQRFAIHVVREWCKKDGTLTILMPKSNLLPNFVEGNMKIVEIGYLKSHLWEQLELPIWLYSNGQPMLINLCNTGPILYRKSTIVIHDLAFLVNPSWFSIPFRFFYKFLIPKLLNNSKIVFTVSETIKNQILECFPRAKTPIVIYNAASAPFKVLNGIEKDRIILTVGSIEPRKNLKTLIKGFQKASLDGYRLIIVGEKNKNFQSLELEAFCENIVFTGRVSDEELVKIYNQAELFVYLSYYEGFGIPPLEAQQCGVPVILSDIDVFHEIYGDSAVYVNPNNEIGISNSIRSLINNPSLRFKYGQMALNNSVNYTWKVSADKIFDVINNLTNK